MCLQALSLISAPRGECEADVCLSSRAPAVTQANVIVDVIAEIRLQLSLLSSFVASIRRVYVLKHDVICNEYFVTYLLESQDN